MSDLKPCPFCGITCLSFEDGSSHRWGVASCDGCGATTGEVRRNYPDDGEWHAEAIKAWNRRAQPAQAVPLYQILTDPENQPNQYGVEFLMRGPKFAFKVGAQQFTLDYEPTEPGEFEFMRDMLINAFSTFTPDVKTAQAVPLLSVLEILDAMPDSIPAAYDGGMMDFARAIESLVRSKLGAVVGMTPFTEAQLERLWLNTPETLKDGISRPRFKKLVKFVEECHQIRTETTE